MEETTTHKGKLILADPRLKAPEFFQSVILIAEHSATGGAMGYILNRPIGRSVGELLGGDVLSDEQRERLGELPVFLGGPVSTEHLTFSALGWSEADDALQYTTHLSAAEAVMHEMEGFHIRAFVGYAGWSEGQLELEMAERSWIPRDPEREVVDPSLAEDLWKTLLRDLGPYNRLVADEPDELGLN